MEQKALKVLQEAIDDIAAMNDYPPAPGEYARIKHTWKAMVLKARRAKKAAALALAYNG
jgi:hypothetical protein